MNNRIASLGSGIKSLGGNRIEGYLVLFSGANDPDLQGDYFTKETNFFIDNYDTRLILYRHGVHPKIKDKQLGRATLVVDDAGVFMQGELLLRDAYESAILELIRAGKLGLSSGSMSHLVEKKQVGKSFQILSWPIGEASLTPMPVEPRTCAAVSLKDLPNAYDFSELDVVLRQPDYNARAEHEWQKFCDNWARFELQRLRII